MALNTNKTHSDLDLDIDFITDTDSNEDSEKTSDKPIVKRKRKKREFRWLNEHPVIKELLSCVEVIVIACIVVFVLTQFIIFNAKVPTGSMNNTIMENNLLIGSRLSYKFSDPQRGDIVIFRYPDNETEIFIKRIIGLPGDIIEIDIDGKLYINGEIYEESYLKEPMDPVPVKQTYIVPDDSYFMMGDNRNHSLDSRFWNNHYVSRDKFLAKAIFKYFPSIKLLK